METCIVLHWQTDKQIIIHQGVFFVKVHYGALCKYYTKVVIVALSACPIVENQKSNDSRTVT